MNIRIRLILTKALVIFSLICSFGTIFSSGKGWGEIYPFLHWKLFSQPLGTHHRHSEYSVYLKSDNNESFIRQKITSTPSFSREEYAYTFDYLVESIIKDSLNMNYNKQRIFTFLKHVFPEGSQYKIIKESFNPGNIILMPQSYDTSVILLNEQ
jgi:hypothetical protein